MYTFNEILTNIASLSDVIQTGVTNLVIVAAAGAAASIACFISTIVLHFRINRN